MFVPLSSLGVNPAQVRWGDEETDTLRIVGLLKDSPRIDAPAKGVVNFAQSFLDTPYAAATLEMPQGEAEMLTVTLDSLDCTTFVETVTALSLTAASGRTSWRDFINNLEQLRYRKGTLDGYASRLHYFSDFVISGISKGIFDEVTPSFPCADYIVKSLDFMSSHRDAYPALADDGNYQAIRRMEDGLRSLRYPVLKKYRFLGDKKAQRMFHDGDIVAFTTDIQGLDVTHMGLVEVVDGIPHLIHASSALGKVVVDQPLVEYLKRNKKITGLRVLRLK